MKRKEDIIISFPLLKLSTPAKSTQKKRKLAPVFLGTQVAASERPRLAKA